MHSAYDILKIIIKGRKVHVTFTHTWKRQRYLGQCPQ